MTGCAAKKSVIIWFLSISLVRPNEKYYLSEGGPRAAASSDARALGLRPAGATFESNTSRPHTGRGPIRATSVVRARRATSTPPNPSALWGDTLSP